MDAKAHSTRRVDLAKELLLLGPQFLSGPFRLDGEQVAEKRRTFSDDLDTLRQDAEDVGDALEAFETPITAVLERYRTLVLSSAEDAFELEVVQAGGQDVGLAVGQAHRLPPIVFS